ncbi:hypothetical protein ATANTOWER_029436 [Ataeniobius toweri]|uniref:Uncharacterized protein n=1 Tax=Ataeniobius toweri TaxID=208326 RepID=A0ABU7AA59_9TELE|nr:hypothetical protein [Ataeniobius toweri]
MLTMLKIQLIKLSDEIVALRSTMMELKDEINKLRKKCEDMDEHTRRCNVWILGVPETSESSCTTAVTKPLTEVLQLDTVREEVRRQAPSYCSQATNIKKYFENVLRFARSRVPLQ